jgi:hypothetical protein
MARIYTYIVFIILLILATVSTQRLRAQPVTFNYTGQVQLYTVPQCVTSLTIDVRGAKGGGPNGGNGARVQGTINVTPGQVLQIYVGGAGICGVGNAFNGGGTGRNAGGGYSPSCGGGGASDIRTGPALSNRIVVAGGGGGRGGGTTNVAGGAGGCATGSTGTGSFGGPGGGGTQFSGGGGGNGWGAGSAGQPGSLGQGGNGANDHCFGIGPGGGGGGGYYGGGGGGADCFPFPALGGGGGGGGSSLTPAGGTCTPNFQSGDGQVIITPNYAANPGTATANPSAVCSGQTSTITLSGYSSGATIQWQSSTNGGVTWTNIPGATSPTYTTPPLTATTCYRAVVTCGISNNSNSVCVTVAATPTSTFTITPTNVCVNATATINYTGNAPTGSTFTWNCGGCAPQPTGSNPAPISWTTAGTYTVTLNVAGPPPTNCPGQPSSAVVTVFPLPVVAFTATSPVCSNQNSTITLTSPNPPQAGDAFTWNCGGCSPPPAGTPGPHNVSWTVGGTLPETKTISISYTRPGCAAVTATQTVTVDPIPTTTFTLSPQPSCVNSNVTINYTGSALPGSVFTWSCGGCSPQPTGSNPGTISWANPGTHTVTLNVTGPPPASCQGQPTSVTITVNPLPVVTFTATSPVCSNQNSSLNLTSPNPTQAGDVFTWNCDGCNPAPPGTPGPHNISWTLGGTTAEVKTISITYARPGCVPVSATQTVSVNPIPIAAFTAVPANGVGVCANNQTPATITFTGTLGTGPHVFTWNCDGCTSGNPTTQGPHTLSWSSPGNKNLTLTVSSAGCVSTQANVNLTVLPVPVASISVSQSAICANSQTLPNPPITTDLNFNGTLGTAPHTYTWNCSNCQGLSDPSQPGPHNVSWSSPGTKLVSLQVVSSSCVSNVATQVITVNRVPTSNFTISPQEVCGNTNAGPNSVTLGFNASQNGAGVGMGATGFTLTWNCDGCLGINPTSTGPMQISWENISASAQVKTVTLQVANNPSGCISGITSVLVTVHPIPSLPMPTNNERCGPGVITLTASPGVNGDVVRWWTTPGAIQPIFAGPAFTINNLTTSSTFYISSYNSVTQCESQRVPITATVNILPGLPSAQPVARCGPGIVTFTASFGIPPADELRLFDAPAGGTFLASTNLPPYTLTVPEPVQVTTQFYLEARFTVTGCTSRVPVIAQINPIPGLPSSRDEYRCGPGTVNFFVAMGNPAGLQVELYSNAVTPTPLDVDFTSPFMLTTPPINQVTVDSFYIAAVDWQTGCKSPRIGVTATVFDVPKPPAPGMVAPRCGPGYVTLTVSVPPPFSGVSVHLYSQAVGGNVIGIDTLAPYLIQSPVIETSTTLFVTSINNQTLCQSPRVPVTVTILPVPSPPSVANATRCGAGIVTFSVYPSGLTQGHRFRLFNQSSYGLLLDSVQATGLNPPPYLLETPPIVSSTTFYIEAYDTVTGCVSNRTLAVAHIDGNLPGPPLVGDVARCGPGSVEVTASMGLPAGSQVRLYTVPSGGFPIQSHAVGDPYVPFKFIINGVVSSATYYVESFNGCASQRVPFTVTINPLPGPPQASVGRRCGGGPVTLSVTMGTPAGNGVYLYGSVGGTVLASDFVFPYELTTPPISFSTEFYVVAVNNVTGCQSLRVPVNAIIDPIPGAVVTTGGKRCGPGPVAFSAAMGAPAGNQIVLYDEDGNEVASSLNSPYELIVPHVSTNTLYYISARNTITGCEGVKIGTQAQIYPVPGPGVPVSSAVARCGPGIVEFTAQMGFPPGDKMLLYTLAAGGDAVASSVNPPYVLQTPSLNSSREFYIEVEHSSTGCKSSRVAVTANILELPDPPSASAVERCGPGNAVITASMGASAGTSIRLYITSAEGDILAEAFSNPYELTTPFLTSNTTFYISAFDIATGCSSPRRSVQVQILEVPGFPIVQSASRCGAGSVSIIASFGFPGGNLIWLYDAPVGGSAISSANQAPLILNTGYLPESRNYYIAVQNTITGCWSERVPVLAEIYPIPGKPQSPDVSRCGRGPITFTALMTAPLGNVVRLYDELLAGLRLDEDYSSPFTLTVPDLTTTAIYYLEVENTITGCRSERTPVAGVYLVPPGPVSVPRVGICGPGAVTFTASMSAPNALGDVIRLYAHPTDGEILAWDNVAPYHLSPPNPVGQTTTFYAAAFNEVNRCEGPRVPAIVEVHRRPSMPIGSWVSRCGSGSVSINVIPGNIIGDKMVLYDSWAGGSPLAEDYGPSFDLVTPFTSVTTTYFIESVATETGCGSERLPVRVTILPKPGAPLVTGGSRCGPGEVQFTAQMQGVGGSEIRLYSSPTSSQALSVANNSPYVLTSPVITTSASYYAAVFDAVTGCESDRSMAQATIFPIPTAPRDQHLRVCGAGAYTIAIPANPLANEVRLYSSLAAGSNAPIAIDANLPYELITHHITTNAIYYLRYYNSLSGCESEPAQVLITVGERPAPPVVSDEKRCGSGKVKFLVSSVVASGGQVRLYSTPNGVDILDFSDAEPYELSTPHLNSGPNAQYTFFVSVFDKQSACESERVAVTARVYETPGTPLVPPAFRCGPGSVIFSLEMSSPSGDQVRLYNDANTDLLLDLDNSSAYELATPIITTNAVYFFSVVNTLTGCQSPRVSGRAVIYPLPGEPLTAQSSRCGPGAALILVNMGIPAGTQVRLYNTPLGGTVLASDGAPPYELETPVITTTSSFYVSSYNQQTGCESSRVLALAEVRRQPSAPTVSPVSRCGRGQAVLSVSMGTIGGEGVALYSGINGGGQLAVDNTFPYELTTPEVLISTEFYVEVFSSDGCTSARVPASVVVNPLPGVPSSAGVSRCGAGVVTFSVTSGAPAGTEMRLYNYASGGLLLGADNSFPYELVTPALTTTTTYYISSFNSATACESPRLEVVARVNLTPGVPDVVEARRCGAGVITFSAAMGTPAGEEFRLYNAAVGGLLLSSDSNPPYTLTSPFITTTSVFFLEVYNSSTGCFSGRSPVRLSVDQAPGVPLVEGVSRCGPGEVVFRPGMSLPSGTQFQLYGVPVGGSVLVSDDLAPYELPIYNIETTTKYYITVLNKVTGCESPRVEVTATINDLPGIPFANKVIHCGSGSITFSAMMGFPAGGSLRLYDSMVDGVLISSDSDSPYELTIPFTSQSGVYYLESYSELTGCSSARFPVEVTVHPALGLPVSGGAWRCGNGPLTFSATIGGAYGTEVRLYSVATGGLPLATDFDAPYELTTPSITESATYYLENYSRITGCVSQRVEVFAEVRALPGAPQAADVVRCGQGSVEFTVLMGNPPGTVIRLWDDNYSAFPISSVALSPYILQTPAITHNRSFFISSQEAAGGCESPRVEVRASIVNPPAPPSVVAKPRCGSGSVNITALMGIPAGNGVRLYTASNGGTPIATANAAPYVLQTPLISGQTIFFIESFESISGCSSARVPVRVEALPRPGAPSASDVTLCGGGEVIFTAVMGSPVGTEIRLYDALTGGNELSVAISPPYELRPGVIATHATYYIESFQAATGCASERREVSAWVRPVPQAPMANDVARCGAGSVEISASMGVPGGTSMRLYDASVGGTVLAGTASAPYVLQTPAYSETTVLYVASYDIGTGCESPRRRVSVNIEPIPQAPLRVYASRCGAGEVRFTLSEGAAPGEELRLYNLPVGGTALAVAGPGTLELVTPAITSTTTYFLARYATASGCASERVNIVAEVLPLPGAPLAAGAERCGRGTVTLSALMGSPAGLGMRLYTQPLGGAPLSTLTDAPYVFTSPVIATSTVFYVESFINGCSSVRVPVTATVTPAPIPPLVSNDGSKCIGETVTLRAEGSANANYVWNGPAGFSAQGQSVMRLLNSTSEAGEYTVVAVIGNCASEPAVTNVGVRGALPEPIPYAYSEFGNSRPYCVGDELKLAIQNFGDFPLGTRFEWVGPSFFTITDAPFPLAHSRLETIHEGEYYVRAFAGNCTSTVGKVLVRVHPLPEAPAASNNGPQCVGGTLQLFASPVDGGANYIWVGPNGFSATGRQHSRSADLINAGIYSVYVISVQGCTSEVATTNVVVNPRPLTPVARATTPLCEGEDLILTAQGPSGARFWWVGPNNYNNTGTAATYTRYAVTAADAGIYTLSAIQNGCTSQSSTVRVVINRAPAFPSIASNSPICVGADAVFTASGSGNNARYVWSGPQGFQAEGGVVSLTNVGLSAAGVYQVWAVENGCSSLAASTTLNVYTLPGIPLVSAPARVCVGGQLILEVSNFEPGLEYYWRGPQEFEAMGSEVIRSITSEAQGGLYEVEASNGFCRSRPGGAAVEVLPSPTRPAVESSSPICSGGLLRLSLINPLNGATYYWRGPNGFMSSGVAVQIANIGTAASGQYSVTAVVQGCSSAFGLSNITVTPTPPTPVASNNGPRCVGHRVTLSVSGGEGIYIWSGPNGYSASGFVNTYELGAVTLGHAGVYSVVSVAGGCTSLAALTTLDVNPIPSPPFLSATTPICAGQMARFLAEGASGLQVEWSGPMNFSANGPAVERLITDLRMGGTYSARAVAPGGCRSEAATVALEVRPSPPAPFLLSNAPVCVGELLILTATGAPANSVVYWEGENAFSAEGFTVSRGTNSVLDGGLYYAVAVANGCSSSIASINASVIDLSAPPNISSNAPLCAGQTLLLTASPIPGVSYFWSGPGGFASTQQQPTRPNMTTATAGTYQVYAKLGQCVSPAIALDVQIIARPETPAPSHNGPLCAGQTLRLTATPIVGASYYWTGPGGFTSTEQYPILNNVQTVQGGQYQVQTVIGSCSSAVSSTIVNVFPTPPTPSAGSDAVVCAGSALQLSATVIAGVSYEWVGPDGFYASSANVTRPNVTTAQAGVYTVRSILGSCASPPSSVRITVLERPTTPDIGNNSPVCVGGVLQLTAAPQQGARYQWSGPAGFTSTAQNPVLENIQTVQAGSYSLIISVGTCTSFTASTQVVVAPGPGTVNVSSNSPICSGSKLELSASSATPGVAYTWEGPNGFRSNASSPNILEASSVHAGVYSVTPRFGDCRLAPIEVTVRVIPLPQTPVAGNNGPICEGQTLQLTASQQPGVSFYWSGPGGYTSTLQNPAITQASALAGGLYTVFAHQEGCTSGVASTIAVVHAFPQGLRAENNGPLCAGQDLVLRAPLVAGASYEWRGPSNFSARSASVTLPSVGTEHSGVYSVTLRIGDCVSESITTSVTILPGLTLAPAGNNGPICEGGTLQLTAPIVEGAVYEWSGPLGFSSTLSSPVLEGVSALEAGVYRVKVRVGSCVAEALPTVAEVIRRPTTPVITTNAPLCAGSTLQLTAQGAVGAEYFWSGHGGFVARGESVEIPFVSVAQGGVYQVVAVIGRCSSFLGSVNVLVRPIPVLPSAGSNSPVCVGGNLQLNAASVMGGSYLWNGPNGFTSTEQNPIILNAPANASGQYTVRAIVEGCTSSLRSVSVLLRPSPGSIAVGNNGAICAGQDLQLTASLVNGAIYSWTGPGGFSSSAQNPVIPGAGLSQAGVYSLVVRLGSCASPMATTRAEIYPSPAGLLAGSNGPVCAGSNLTLTATFIPGAVYRWSGPLGYVSEEQNPVISNITTTQSGTYNVVAYVGACSSEAASVLVQVNPTPGAVVASNTGPACTGNAVTLQVNSIPGATYRWSGPNGFTSVEQNPTISRLGTQHAGNYLVTVSIGGCSAPAAVTRVQVGVTPTGLFAMNNGPVCVGGVLQLTAPLISGVTYEWRGPNNYVSNEQNPLISNVATYQAGVYSVVARQGNCTSNAATTAVIVMETLPPFTAGSNTPICAGDSIHLSAPTIAGAVYSWTGPAGFTSSLQNPSIPAAEVNRSGNYQLVVRVGACTSSPSQTRVVVQSRPTRPAVSSNSPLCANQTLRFSGTEIAGFRYEWLGPNGFSAQGLNVSIAAVGAQHSGVYSVTAQNLSTGCRSLPTEIAIAINAPNAAFSSGDEQVCRGDSLSVGLNVSGSLPGVLQYRENGVLKTANITALPFNWNVTPSQTVVYQLVSITDSWGCTQTLSQEKAVSVAPTPEAIVPQEVRVCAGQSGLAPVTVSGLGAATPWRLLYEEGGSVRSVEGVGNRTVEVPVGGASTRLQLLNITNTEAGCVRDYAGTSSYADLLRLPVPSIRFNTAEVSVCRGASALLPLSLSGRGPWEVTYLENGILRTQTLEVAPGALIVNPEINSVYELVGVRDANGCRSSLGEDSEGKRMAVTLLESPSAAFRESSLEVCNGSLALLPLALTGISPWQVEYAVNGVVQSPWVLGDISSSSPLNIEKEMSVSGAREYRLLAVTDSRGCRREVNSTLTLNVKPGPAVRIISQTEASCGGASLTAAAEGGSGLYTFRLGGETNTSGKFANLPAGVYTLTVTDGGCSSSQIVTITAAQTPFFTSLTAESANTVRAVWAPINRAQSYNVRYRISGSNNDWVVIEGLRTTEVIINELLAGTTYEFELQAVCENDVKLAWGTGDAVTTGIVGCGSVVGVSVHNITSTSALVNWQGGAGVVCYQISYGPVNLSPDLWTDSNLAPAPATSFTLTGLTPGVEYGVRVRANCTACSRTLGLRSVWSQTARFNTLSAKGQSVPENIGEVWVYPNPSRGAALARYPQAYGRVADVFALDIQGRKVEVKQEFQPVAGEVGLDFTHLSSGVYTLWLIYENGLTSRIRVVVE